MQHCLWPTYDKIKEFRKLPMYAVVTIRIFARIKINFFLSFATYLLANFVKFANAHILTNTYCIGNQFYFYDLGRRKHVLHWLACFYGSNGNSSASSIAYHLTIYEMKAFMTALAAGHMKKPWTQLHY